MSHEHFLKRIGRNLQLFALSSAGNVHDTCRIGIKFGALKYMLTQSCTCTQAVISYTHTSHTVIMACVCVCVCVCAA